MANMNAAAKRLKEGKDLKSTNGVQSKSPLENKITVKVRKLVIWLGLFVCFALSVDALLFPRLCCGTAPATTYNRGANGIWLRYLWYFGKHSDAALGSLIEKLKQGQFKYLYFHVRSVDEQGKLMHRYKDNALKINARIKEAMPGAKSIAWIYVQSVYLQAKQKTTDISKAEIRKNMVQEAKYLVEECGFDGVQWDYEFYPSGNKDMLALLDETRQALPHAFISVATPCWYPGTLWGFSDADFKELAAHCDQIAVMCYDTFFYYPRAYSWLVAQQAKHVTRGCTLANQESSKLRGQEGRKCTVILGLPVYDEGTSGHLTHSENLRTALHGVNAGLNELAKRDRSRGNTEKDSEHPARSLESFEGVAPFAEYTMDEGEWRDFQKFWVAP
jgi:hypothetical protein